MSTELVPVKSLDDFRLSHLIRIEAALTPAQQATQDLFACFDELFQKTPPAFRDFSLRFLKSCGLPIVYQGLPFWAERAARHIFTICYPTLRNSDLMHPTAEDFGRFSGHLLAVVLHAKNGTAIFQRLPKETSDELRACFLKIEQPLQVLIHDGMSQPPNEAEAFLRGMNHAFARTFDAVGLPRGWNTNSPVLLALCMGWNYIVNQRPSLSVFHDQLAKILGQQETGSEDRVKKICHRIGLRFSGDRAAGSQGTTPILDVPTAPGATPDK